MSFRCGTCNEAQPSGTRPIRTVVEVRKRIYRVNGSDAWGWEIAREVDMCEPCETRVVDLSHQLYEAGVPLIGTTNVQGLKTKMSEVLHAQAKG